MSHLRSVLIHVVPSLLMVLAIESGALANTAPDGDPPASDPAPAPSSQWVSVHDEVGIMSQAALEEISQSATAEAAKHNVEPTQMRITLVVLDHLEALRGVRVSITTPDITLDDPNGDSRGPLVAECPGCSEDGLKTASIEGVLEALSQLEDLRAQRDAERRAKEAEANETEEPPISSGVPKSEPPVDEPRRTRRPLGALGWTGITAVSIGTAGLATGITFLAMGKRPLSTMTGKDLLRNFMTPGYVLLGTGGAVALSGAIMVAVDRRRARRTSSTALLLPGPGGLTLSGRF